MAVTVILEFKVTLQLTVLVVVHPDHEEKLLLPAVFGAVRPTGVPDEKVAVKLVVPLVTRPVRESPYEITTPLAGFVEFTVSV